MNKAGSAAKVKLNTFDDLFGTSAMMTGEKELVEIALTELHPFRNHPFLVKEDERLAELTESIRQHGVLIPGIVRPRPEGGYEIISGHTRKRACELAGKESMPVYIRDYSDDDATVIMVDTNIQREDVLPSEKARAYRMKYDAVKHQGCKSGKNSLENLGEAAGESAKTVQRYIWLSRLTKELLAMVDDKTLGIVQGIDISFLKEPEQHWVQYCIEQGATVSSSQSAELKEYSRKGNLTALITRKILMKEEKKKLPKIIIKADKLKEYFPVNYSCEEMEKVIIDLLEQWKKDQ